MGSFVVSCVDRYDSPYTHVCIKGLGGLCTETGRRWHMPAEEVIAAILDETHDFVVIAGGRHVPVVVERRPGGLLCLRTAADGPRDNYLLLRPSCPNLRILPDTPT